VLTAAEVLPPLAALAPTAAHTDAWTDSRNRRRTPSEPTDDVHNECTSTLAANTAATRVSEKPQSITKPESRQLVNTPRYGVEMKLTDIT
jgi:hypothetical protein